MVRKFAAAGAVALLLAVSGCGSDVERPSLSEVEKKIETGDDLLTLGDQKLNDKSYKCIAKALEDSKLSNEALKAVIEGDEKFKGDDDDADALKDVSKGKIADCIKDNFTLE